VAQLTPPAIATTNRYPANVANVDQHHYENSSPSPDLASLNRDEANAAPKPLPPPPPQESRDPILDMEADGHDTPLDSGSDGSQNGDSHGAGESGGTNGKGKEKARQDGWMGSSSLPPADTAITSVSEDGALLTPRSPSCTEY
jgi:hypothetical protein